MTESIRILTPEQVELDYEVAGIGSRFVAGLLDGLIQAGLLLAGYLVALLFGIRALFSGGSLRLTLSSSVAAALLIVYVFVVFWGYFLYFETRWSGQTPGKRAVGLRVIRDGGQPIDLQAAFIRNVVRLVDLLPGFYGIGFITMFISPHWKRLGDHAAGTIVIKERKRPLAAFSPPEATGKPWAVSDFTLLDDRMLGQVARLKREDYQAIQRFFARRSQLDHRTASRLAQELATPLAARLGIGSVEDERSSEQLLSEVARAYERLHGS